MKEQLAIGRGEFFGNRASDAAARAGDEVTLHGRERNRRTSNGQRPILNDVEALAAASASTACAA
jgi:hypothetical protein